MKSILSMVIGACLACCAIEAGAEEPITLQKIQLDIARQSLTDALNAWAEQTGFQLVCLAPEVAREVVAPKMKGVFTAMGALEQLLSGTTLIYEFTSERTVTVRARFTATSQTTGYLDRVDVPRLQIAALDAVEDGNSRIAQNDASRSNDAKTSARRNPSPENREVEELEEIVVTGTHIRGNVNTPQVAIYTRADIERSGHSSTQDFVQSLPLNFKGGALGGSEDGVVGSGIKAATNVSNASTVNLRGLGEGSTLVLINGRRVAPSAYGSAVDISLIPIGAIERVEILADGSSAIYGSDAVAGVVNFILRKEFDGLETTARFGSGTNSGPTERDFSQAAGVHWERGGGFISLQYRDRDRLRSADRSFTADTAQPTDLLPHSRQTGVALSVHHEPVDTVELFADGLYADQDSDRYFTDSTRTLTQAETKRSSFTGGARFDVPLDWEVSLTGSYSTEDTGLVLNQDPPDPDYTNGTPYLDNEFELEAADLQLEGPLANIGGRKIRAALGASYRGEQLISTIPWLESTTDVHRNVRAAYAEVFAPLVSDTNAVKFLKRLSISAAYRYDDYSDFGSTANPHFAITYAPIDAIDLRASYSHSFRAPNTHELISVGVGQFLRVFDFPAPGGGTVPTVVLTGSNRELTPEKSENYSVGLDFKPPTIDGLRATLGYYHIKFQDRIIFPPPDFGALLRPEVYGSLITPLPDDAAAQALVDEETSKGALFFGTSVEGVRYAYSVRQQNAAIVRQSGIDAMVEYSSEVGSLQYFGRLSGSYIDKIETGFTAVSQPTNLVDLYGTPLRLRMRADASIQRGIWQLNAALNYSKGYTDTTPVPPADISSWTTADVGVRLTPAAGLTVALSAINVFDSDPPRVVGGGISQVHYDPANAEPRGRFVSIEIQKAWGRR